MWRRFLILCAVGVGALAGVAVALKSERVADNLRQTLIEVAQRRADVLLAIDHLELELVPPGLQLTGISAALAGDDAPRVSVRRAHLVLRPWPSVSGALVVQDLDLDGLIIDTPLPTLPSFSTGKRAIALDVASLEVTNTNVRLVTERGTLELHGLDLLMTPSRAGRDLALEIDEGSWQAARTVGFELHALATLGGSLDRPEHLTINRGDLDLRRLAVALSGDVTFDTGPSLDLHATSHSPLERLGDLLQDLPPLSGDARVELAAVGLLQAPILEGTLVVDNLTIGTTLVGQTDLAATLVGDKLRADKLSIVHPNAGSVTGRGDMTLAEGLPITAEFDLSHGSLPHILELAGLKGAWVEMPVTGHFAAQGLLLPFRLEINTECKVERFAVLDRSYLNPEAQTLLAFGDTLINGVFTLTPRNVVLGSLGVSRGTSRLSVDGSLSYDPSRGMDLRAQGAPFDFASIGPIANVPFAGRGQAAVVVEGPYADPTVSATLDMEALTILGVDVGDAKGTLIYNGKVLDIDSATFRKDTATATGSARLDFGVLPFAVTGNATFEHLPLYDLLVPSGFTPTLAARFQALGDGAVAVTGPLALPRGEATYHSRALKVDGAALGRCDLQATFGDPALPFSVDLALAPETGALRSRLAFKPGAVMQADIEASEIPLALVRPLVGDIPISGTLSGTGHLGGPLRSLSGEWRATINRLVAYGVRLETAEITATVAQSDMQMKGTLLSGAARAQSTLRLNERLPFTASASYENLDLGRLWPLTRDLRLQASGTFFSQGAFTEATDIMADVEFERFTMTWGPLTLGAARPVLLQYADRTSRVGDMVLVNSGTTVKVDGSITVAGDTDLRIAASGDMKQLAALGLRLDWLRGNYELATSLAGPLGALQFGGGVTLENAALRLPMSEQVLADINAECHFRGRSIAIEKGTATLGGGTVSLGGQVLLPLDGRTELNLRADLNNVTIRPSTDLSFTLAGALALLGTSDDLLLRGRLRVPALRYSANLDLERLIPRRNAPPLKVPAMEPGKAIRLAIAVQAPNNLILANNMVEAEAQADLTITGTTERIGLVGSLTPLWAKVRYRDNTFKLERGTVDFSDEYRIFTQFDLRATTEACNMKIAVEVHGDSDSFNVVPSGNDVSGIASQQDVLSCIQFGMRLRDYENQSRAANTTGAGTLNDPLLGSAIDALWTVSGMDATVKRLFPIKLDEVRLESGWSSFFRRTTTRVLVAKELGDNFQLKYSRALDETDDQTVAVQYRLSDIYAVQGTWLSGRKVYGGDFGLDLRLRWELR